MQSERTCPKFNTAAHDLNPGFSIWSLRPVTELVSYTTTSTNVQ